LTDFMQSTSSFPWQVSFYFYSYKTFFSARTFQKSFV